MFSTSRVLAVAIALPLASGSILSLADGLSSVPGANTKTAGSAAPNVLSPELAEKVVVQGSNPLENPSADFSFYGYSTDGPMLPALGTNVEATKTEPDKNTYLILPKLSGADPNYNYGHHFLFQGHENGKKDSSGTANGYITRINLDADAAHRVTLLATTDSDGKALPTIDGSTWYPWAQRLLFSAEGSHGGGVWQATLDFPPVVDSLTGIIGQGGYEGMQADPRGEIWIVEDSGGVNGTGANFRTRQPNSFIYRFIPNNSSNLKQGGKLQALQVVSKNTGQPIVFHEGQADADATAPEQHELHTYGNRLRTHWITIHDTSVDGTAPFSANALAKAKLATPFKRPENGQFRPGTGFREFYFDTTGDTDNRTSVGAFGGFGAIFKLTQASPDANDGVLSLFYLSDAAHSSLDDVAFWSANQVVFVQDMGDTLHTQINAVDSAFMFDVRVDYSKPANQPVRILALGRDASATIDS